MKNKTKPNVFIIESLRFDDEKSRRKEGKFISHILNLAGRDYQYYYIRTKSELKEVLLFFEESKFRYLHLSCHADADGIALTLDDIGIQEMGSLFRPYLKDRRIFFSACEIVTPSLAATLLKETGCLSVIGPSKSVGFDEAALFWASFYHLMFKNSSMKRKDIKLNSA